MNSGASVSSRGHIPGSGVSGVWRQRGLASTRRRVDASKNRRVGSSTRRRVDASTRRRVDASTPRRLDASTRRRLDASTPRRVDALTRRRVDASTCHFRKVLVEKSTSRRRYLFPSEVTDLFGYFEMTFQRSWSRNEKSGSQYCCDLHEDDP